MFSPVKLAQNAEAAKDGQLPEWGLQHEDFVMEPKYDGWRGLMHVKGEDSRREDSRLYSRTGNSKGLNVPHIIDALRYALPDDTWLDGEIVVFKEDGTQEWGGAQSIMGGNPKARGVSDKATFVVFDILAFNGQDVRRLPWTERRKALDKIFGAWQHAWGTAVTLAPYMKPSMEAYTALVQGGWEGAIVKRKNAPYASGKRGFGWYKLKAEDTMDAVVMDRVAGSEYGAFVFGQVKDGKLQRRGKCKVYSKFDHLQPGDVISVQYMGIMPSGAPRHPVVVAVREDKPADECDWTVA